MASLSSSFQFYPITRVPTKSFRRQMITAVASERSTVPQNTSPLPEREIPGEYEPPVIGAWKDRQDYFYNEGREKFFQSRIDKYNSTVFRANMPPGPFIASDPRVIVLLDGKSFPILFDNDKVEKKDVFTGTYAPSVEFTGGYRILSYLDPSEPNHSKLKNLLFYMLSSRREYIIPEFQMSYAKGFENLEKEVMATGKGDFGAINDQAAFNFLGKAFFGADPTTTELGSDGPRIIGIWVLFQLHPLISAGLPRFIDDLLLHTFRLPPFLIKKNYNKLYDFFYRNSANFFVEGEKVGLSRDEVCHNLLFATCFNTFGGIKILFPSIFKQLGLVGEKIHADLAQEIRSAIKSAGGKVTMAAMENMPLMKSLVYEALRIDPPVPLQYAKAKRDLVIESHDFSFRVKKGEMLFGFQPFATRDPKIFDRPEEFLSNRFVGEEGEKLL